MADLLRLKQVISDSTFFKKLASLDTMDDVLDELSAVGLDLQPQELLRSLDALFPKNRDELDEDALAAVAGGQGYLVRNPFRTLPMT